MTNIKELALQEANDMLLQHYYDDGDYTSFSVELCTRFLAAYLKEQEPDCWAVLTPNGSKLVSPEEAKGLLKAYPLYAAPPLPAIPDERIEKYNELLYAVEHKFPNETRHETALRYIRERERRDETVAKLTNSAAGEVKQP